MDNLSKSEAKRLSPGTLAFYGDCVYEICARRKVVSLGDRPSAELHNMSVKMVRASFQAAAYEKLLNTVSEEEADILRRGRNASGLNPPKSSNPAEYHKATAVEALFGYLSLIGARERIEELFSFITDDTKG
ncbi:MAG: ribonuclease III [Ruminiclostridium sp.]|nr:ribonuclease III [Ruminiclostridium sp.]